MRRLESTRAIRTITRSIFVILIVVALTPLILMMGVAGYEFHTAYRAKVLAYLEQLVEKHAQNIDTFLNEKLADIRVVAATSSYTQLSDEDYLQNLLLALQEQHGGVFVDLGVVNRDGMQVAYAGPFKLGRANYAGAGWFEEARSKKFYVSDVFMGLRGLPHFIVAVRHTEKDGTQWILRGTIDFVAFNRLVENIRGGETGQAFIINREGDFQTQPRTDLSSYTPVLRDFIWEEGRGDTRAVAGRESWTAYQGARPQVGRPVYNFSGINPANGDKAVYVVTLLKGGEWALVYQQDTADAFASLYRARNVSLIVLILGGIAIMVTAAILTRRIGDRILRMDREKEMMNEKVIEAGKLASLGELAAGIAHEINNPVAIMVEESGWVEDLLEEDEFHDTENVREIHRALTQIQTQGRRCKQITHKLLSFARKTDPVQREVKINEIIREVAELSEQHARFANAKIIANLSENLPPVVVAPSEMQQVFLNLINNAIDAIDHKEGGLVTLTSHYADGFVVVDVSDTGQGIPEPNLKRIFDPFFTTKPVGKGTGLGLSICYGIVQRLGGKITVNSAVGVGTTFHIHLPVAAGAVPAAEPGQGNGTSGSAPAA